MYGWINKVEFLVNYEQNYPFQYSIIIKMLPKKENEEFCLKQIKE